MSYSYYIIIVVLLMTGACREGPSLQESEGGNRPSSQAEEQVVNEWNAQDLREASLNGRINIVREAVEQNVNLQEPDQLGRTALMFASYNGHAEIVRFLTDQGADIHNQDERGLTPLMYAASGPFPETVELLLERGAEIDATDHGEPRRTALMFAAGEGNPEVVRILLDTGADISIEYTDGETALEIARNNNHADVVKLLEENL